jgi:hypothetical protein
MEMLSIHDNNKEEKWIRHYSSCHKILLVGEGDFSFAACLGKAFGSSVNIKYHDAEVFKSCNKLKGARGTWMYHNAWS